MADPPTHFFKFIPPGSKFDISLPSSFLTHGRFSKATLSRGGHQWSVDIDDGVFGDGWRRFLKENGVQESDFIVFKHQGGMMFDFLVFDQSTCERQYRQMSDDMDVEEPPTESDTHSPMNKKKRKRNDNASQEEENYLEPGLLVNKATSSTVNNHPYFISNLKPYNFKSWTMHLPSDFRKLSGLKAGEVILIDDNHRSWKVQLRKRKGVEHVQLHGLRAFLVANKLEVGDAFKCELVKKGKNRPPVVNFSCLTPNGEDGRRYFMGELKSCNIQRSRLYLPREFVKFSGLINKKRMILKNAEDGRLWTVKLRKYKDGLYISQGWKEFRVANELKEGDCFRLEVVDKGEVPIVAKFCLTNLKKRKKNDIASQEEENCQVMKEPGSLVNKATSSTVDNHPYFISNLKPYNFQNWAMNLSSDFRKRSGLKAGEVILIDDNHRSWKVQLNKTHDLLRGLRDFLVANKLEVGDAFKCELVEKEKNKPPVVNFSCLTPTEEDGRRYFINVFKSYNLQQSYLYLPQKFARFNGLINKKKLVLKNPEEERLWIVESKTYKDRYYIRQGWKEFHVANGLKAGDCFKMEVVDHGEVPIVNLYLQRKSTKAS